MLVSSVYINSVSLNIYFTVFAWKFVVNERRKKNIRKSRKMQKTVWTYGWEWVTLKWEGKKLILFFCTNRNIFNKTLDFTSQWFLEFVGVVGELAGAAKSSLLCLPFPQHSSFILVFLKLWHRNNSFVSLLFHPFIPCAFGKLFLRWLWQPSQKSLARYADRTNERINSNAFSWIVRSTSKLSSMTHFSSITIILLHLNVTKWATQWIKLLKS